MKMRHHAKRVKRENFLRAKPTSFENEYLPKRGFPGINRVKALILATVQRVGEKKSVTTR